MILEIDREQFGLDLRWRAIVHDHHVIRAHLLRQEDLSDPKTLQVLFKPSTELGLGGEDSGISSFFAARAGVAWGRVTVRIRKLQLPSCLYVLIYQNRVSVWINNHKASRASRAFVCFRNQFYATIFELALQFSNVREIP